MLVRTSARIRPAVNLTHETADENHNMTDELSKHYVKATRRTLGLLISSSPAVLPGPVTMLRTPFGKPA